MDTKALAGTLGNLDRNTLGKKIRPRTQVSQEGIRVLDTNGYSASFS